MNKRNTLSPLSLLYTSLSYTSLFCVGLGLSALTAAWGQAPLPPPPPLLGPAPNAAPPPALPQNPPPAVPLQAAPLPNRETAPPVLAAGPTVIRVDAAAGRHPISPLIYGVAFASKEQLLALNAPLNRSGGNGMTTYNWLENATNHAADWYYESLPEKGTAPGQLTDDFIADSKAGGAVPMLTIPTVGWVAKLGPDRQMLPSFSVAKYGPQQKAERDAGNGVKPDGKTHLAGNDLNDANIPADAKFQKAWITHLIGKWGKSSTGGVRYYFYDNEPSLWHETHRDIHPQGETMTEERDAMLAYGTMVKSLDPGATLLGPEEWGWPGYFSSGADLQYSGAHNYQGHPDKDAHGGMDMIPWLLTEMRRHEQQTKQRLLDVLTVHIYPQNGEFTDTVDAKMAGFRNRSTRALWDPNYTDESWIKDKVMLIPRLKQWVKTYYPGTKIGITEYNWGAEKNIGGATAQADIYGIFGREGIDLATRWTTPDIGTPTFKAMQMYRNYDGKKSGFGDVSVSATVPDPDTLSSFAAVRSSDKALTVMVINKSLSGPTPVALALAHFAGKGAAQAWQLTSANTLTRLPNVPVSKNTLAATLPAQSITLFVIPKR